MFKNKQFYHSTTKKAIVAFGTIFNNIHITRLNSAGEVAQSLRVPLAYSQKQRFLSRIAQIPDAESRGEVAITLPRMGFEILGFQYDAERKISPIQKNRALTTETTLSARTTFVSTPYDISIALYLFAKNQEDALQIAEQIMPYFNPDFNITVNDLPEMGIKRDIKIVLDSISYEDNYEGAFDQRQSIIWTFNFTMKLNYYGYVDNEGIIRKAIATTWQNPDLAGEYLRQTYSVENTRATATATLTGDSVSSIALTYSGDKYTYAPNVTIASPPTLETAIGPDYGSGLDFVLCDSGGSVTGSLGSGYSTGTYDLVGGTGQNGSLSMTSTGAVVGATSNLTIVDGGSGYTVGDILLIDGGNQNAYIKVTGLTTVPSSRARATAIMDGDKIKSITVTDGGAGYITAPTVTIEAPSNHEELPGPADAYRFVEEFEQSYE